MKIERGRCRSDQALEQAYEQGGFLPADRRLLTELVYGVLRHRNRLDWALEQFCKKPLSRLSPTLKTILRIGAYQLLFLDRIPDRAVIDESVRLTRQKGAKQISGFVNAALRALAINRPDIVYPDPSTEPERYLSIFFSHPSWLVRRWLLRNGFEKTLLLCESNNQPAPLTLRANRLRTTRDELLNELTAQGITAEPCRISPAGLKVKGSEVLNSVPYRRGWFYVQDEAAQLVVLCLTPQPGETILDACAAPGGKSTHMAEVMENKGRIIAQDSQPERLKRVAENCGRLGVEIVERRQGNSRGSNLSGLDFDRILVDAPCSGLGVLRRNPEGKWLKTENLIGQYQQTQLEILQGISSHLKPGGILVYSTCSTEPEENQEVIGKFLENHPEYRVQDLRNDLAPAAAGLVTPEGYLFTAWNQESMDGFFAAKLRKQHKEKA